MTNAADIQEAADELHRSGVLTIQRSITYDQLVILLTARVNTLLKDDFAALIQLLYTMDISEEKLRYYLKQNAGEMAAITIAKLMIERQLQKLAARRLFGRNDNIPEEERW